MPPEKRASDSGKMPPPPRNAPSRNITDTEGWKTSQKGVKRFWTNYKKLLRDSFDRMSRREQEELIDKFSMIITIGVTVLVILMFYSLIPLFLRVLGLPVAMLAAWWAGQRIVAPVVIDRFSHLLKPYEREEDDDEENHREDR